ncbi:MAG: AMP-binding protein, partial [Bacteroidota bacterium]
MDKQHPWDPHYPHKVPPTIEPDSYPSLVSMLEESLARYRDLPMYENMGKTLTYGQVDTLSQAFAAYLQHHTTLQPGDRVAIQLPNLLQYPIALLGTLRAGMVVVNVNPLYTPYETAHHLKDAQAKAILILANFAHHLVQILPQTHLKTILVTEVGDSLGNIRGQLVNWAVKYLRKLVPHYHLPQAIPFKKALRMGQNEQFQPIPLQAHQPAFLQYTGGTTGVAKGAVLTHRNMVANIEQMRVCIRVQLNEREEIAITPLPLYHIFSLTVNLFAMIRLGAKNVLITNPRDLPSFLKEL